VVSLAVSIPVNLFTQRYDDGWFEQTAFDNKNLTPITSWIHVGLAFLFTLATFKTVSDLREEAKEAYVEYEREKNRVKDHDWMRARTLHVQGLLPKDRRGDMLRNEIEVMLKPIGGKVLDVVVIPDFQSLFDLETARKDLDDLHTLIEAQKPHKLTSCLVSTYYKSMKHSHREFYEEHA